MFQNLLTHDIHVTLQGPPGTGKSFVGVALVNLLLSMNVAQDHGPILVRNTGLPLFFPGLLLLQGMEMVWVLGVPALQDIPVKHVFV